MFSKLNVVHDNLYKFLGFFLIFLFCFCFFFASFSLKLEYFEKYYHFTSQGHALSSSSEDSSPPTVSTVIRFTKSPFCTRRKTHRGRGQQQIHLEKADTSFPFSKDVCLIQISPQNESTVNKSTTGSHHKLDSTGTISDFQCLNKNLHRYTSLYHKRQIIKDSLKCVTATILVMTLDDLKDFVKNC